MKEIIILSSDCFGKQTITTQIKLNLKRLIIFIHKGALK